MSNKRLEIWKDEDAYTVCPFYKGEKVVAIRHESCIKGKNSVEYFASEDDKKIYKKCFCQSLHNYELCRHYRALNELYKKEDES